MSLSHILGLQNVLCTLHTVYKNTGKRCQSSLAWVKCSRAAVAMTPMLWDITVLRYFSMGCSIKGHAVCVQILPHQHLYTLNSPCMKIRAQMSPLTSTEYVLKFAKHIKTFCKGSYKCWTRWYTKATTAVCGTCCLKPYLKSKEKTIHLVSFGQIFLSFLPLLSYPFFLWSPFFSLQLPGLPSTL